MNYLTKEDREFLEQNRVGISVCSHRKMADPKTKTYEEGPSYVAQFIDVGSQAVLHVHTSPSDEQSAVMDGLSELKKNGIKRPKMATPGEVEALEKEIEDLKRRLSDNEQPKTKQPKA